MTPRVGGFTLLSLQTKKKSSLIGMQIIVLVNMLVFPNSLSLIFFVSSTKSLSWHTTRPCYISSPFGQLPIERDWNGLNPAGKKQSKFTNDLSVTSSMIYKPSFVSSVSFPFKETENLTFQSKFLQTDRESADPAALQGYKVPT